MIPVGRAVPLFFVTEGLQMETPAKTPESNASNVAFNLVSHAMVDEHISPGEALAQLFEKMANITRNVAGDQRVASSDWNEGFVGLKAKSDEELSELFGRQELAIGETWAQQWLLTHIAKVFYEEMERLCLASPVATAMKSVVYDASGKVESWSLHERSE